MRYLLLFLFFFAAFYSKAQAQLDWLLNDIDQNRPGLEKRLNYHSSIQPRLIQGSQIVVDSTKSLEKINNRSKVIHVVPAADFGVGYGKHVLYRAMAGLNAEANFNSKLYARFSYLHGIGRNDSFFEPKTTIARSIDSNLNQNIDLRGRVSFTPNRFFNFQGGWDNQFIGEGSRSLFLSDYGRPSGFAMTRLNFSRVEYVVMYQHFQERLPLEQRINKFATTHYLSLNATKWFQIGLFETVIFQPKDTLLNRGFEPEYLNPVIFFRPQEYALGSADNILIGIDAKLTFGRYTLYSQLALDEFNLADIQGRTRWWANKFAIQMGAKTYFNKNDNRFFVRGEMNIIRPYTYAHLSVAQSYTNQGFPLAHPNGANMAELLAELQWKNKRWNGSAFVSYSLKGYDIDTVNWGGNIAIPYINRPVELNDFGHRIGQGKGNNAFLVQLRVSYDIVPKWRLQAFAETNLRYNTFLNESPVVVLFGLRSRLWNDYRNY